MTDLTINQIRNHIITLPNRPPAMLANAVAMVYDVETRQVNQAVQRNPDRFPADFCFKLSPDEVDFMVSQNVIPINSLGKFGGHLPWMFTRYGANQLSTVLKSPVAAKRSVQIMRAFSFFEEAAQSGPKAMRDAIGPELYDKFFGGFQQHGSAATDTIPINRQYYQAMLANNNLLEDNNELLRRLLDRAENSRQQRRNFTPEEDAMVLELRSQGLSHRQIGERIGRVPESIRSCLRRLEGRNG